MSTITLPNIRVGSDLQVRARLKDGGVAIDWSTLQNIKACIYSDAQRALAGRCAFSIDEEDSTLLVCTYAANKPQYLGVNRIVISVKYMGETKTYDKPAFTFVRWTDDQAGEQITIDDPDVDVEISVEDISSSILQEAVDAAFTAADRANEAAAAAEHMVDIHTGPKGDKGDTGATPNISIGTVTTVEPDEPAAASMSGTPEAPVLNLSIPKGLVGDTPNFTVGTVTTGEPGTPVVVTLTGTAEAPVLNITIPQGAQGNSGYQGAAGELQVVNNLTDGGATAALSAEMGKVLDGKVSQLQQEVTADISQLEAKVSDLNIEVSGTSLVREHSFIGGWSITSSSWTKDTSERRVGVQEFLLTQGDTIVINGSVCRMYVGYVSLEGAHGSQGWLTANLTAPVTGYYVLTLEGVPSFVLSDTDELTRYISVIRAESQVLRNALINENLTEQLNVLSNATSRIYPDFAMFSENLCDVRNGAWVQNTYKWELTGIPVTEGDTLYLRGTFENGIRTAVESYTGGAPRSYNPTAYVGFLNASGTQISQINMSIGDNRLVVNQASGVVPSGAVTAKITISNNVGNLPVYLLKDNWKSVHLYVGTKPRVYNYDIPYPSTMLDTEKMLDTISSVRLESVTRAGVKESGNLLDFTSKDEWSHRSLGTYNEENNYILQSRMYPVTGGTTIHLYQGGGAREYARFLLDNGLTGLTIYIEEFDQYGARKNSIGASIGTGAGHYSATLRSDTCYIAFLIKNSSSVELNIEDFAKWSEFLTLYLGTEDMERGYNVKPHWVKDDGIPSYWGNTIETKVATIKTLDCTIGAHGVSFAFITDPHYPNNARVSPYILREIYRRTSVNMLVNGGDIINGSTKDLALLDLRAWMDDFKDFKPYVIKGNHDMNTNGAPAGNAFTDDDWYAICVKQIEGELTSPVPYFYIDNKAQKVRFVFLDTKAAATVIDDDQITWMETHISELGAGWSVVVFAHKVYTDENTIDASGTKILNSLNGIYDNLSATLVGVITGHTHKDFVKTTEKGYPVIVTTCDSCPQNGTINGVLRQLGTTTECAFDIMHIDTTARKVYATRIGAGSDREITY